MREELHAALINRMAELGVMADPEAVGCWTEQLDFKQSGPKLYPSDQASWDVVGSVSGFLVAEVAFQLFGDTVARTRIIGNLLQNPLKIMPEDSVEGAYGWTARCELKTEMDGDAGGVLVTQLRFEVNAGLFIGVTPPEAGNPLSVNVGGPDAIAEGDFVEVGVIDHG